MHGARKRQNSEMEETQEGLQGGGGTGAAGQKQGRVQGHSSTEGVVTITTTPSKGTRTSSSTSKGSKSPLYPRRSTTDQVSF